MSTTTPIIYASTSLPPLPGYPSPKEGERYIGTILRAGGIGHHIFRISTTRGPRKTWQNALNYAAANGGELPDRVESALLFTTRAEGEFDPDWYWTREQHTEYGAFAWCQNFNNGNQNDHSKHSKLHVVLVRRVAI